MKKKMNLIVAFDLADRFKRLEEHFNTLDCEKPLTEDSWEEHVGYIRACILDPDPDAIDEMIKIFKLALDQMDDLSERVENIKEKIEEVLRDNYYEIP